MRSNLGLLASITSQTSVLGFSFAKSYSLWPIFTFLAALAICLFLSAISVASGDSAADFLPKALLPSAPLVPRFPLVPAVAEYNSAKSSSTALPFNGT